MLVVRCRWLPLQSPFRGLTCFFLRREADVGSAAAPYNLTCGILCFAPMLRNTRLLLRLLAGHPHGRWCRHMRTTPGSGTPVESRFGSPASPVATPQRDAPHITWSAHHTANHKLARHLHDTSHTRYNRPLPAHLGAISGTAGAIVPPAMRSAMEARPSVTIACPGGATAALARTELRHGWRLPAAQHHGIHHTAAWSPVPVDGFCAGHASLSRDGFPWLRRVHSTDHLRRGRERGGGGTRRPAGPVVHAASSRLLLPLPASPACGHHRAGAGTTWCRELPAGAGPGVPRGRGAANGQRPAHGSGAAAAGVHVAAGAGRPAGTVPGDHGN